MGKKKEKVSKFKEVLDLGLGVVDLWMDFRKSFRKALSGQEVERQDEQHFLQVKSDLARNQRALAQKLPEGLQYGSGDITELMGQSVSISNISDLPPVDKKNLYDRWHKVYIALQRMVGVLELLDQGYHIQFKKAKARSQNVKANLAANGADKKKKSSAAVIVVTIVVIVAVGYYLGKNVLQVF